MSNQPPNDKGGFTSFVRKSVDKANTALKFVPFDKKENEVDAAISKKEHRRAQVRKAQVEHRQRKENHIKTLEQEISELRELIDDVENQSRLFKLENEAIKVALRTSTSSQLNIQPPLQDSLPDSYTYSHNSPDSKDIFTSPHFAFPTQSHSQSHSFDAIATVDFDEMMNVTCLQLRPGVDLGLLPDATVTVPSSNQLSTLAISNDSNQVRISPSITPAPSTADTTGTDTPQLATELRAAHDDPEVALVAINFILALEYPCRTHFLPPSSGPEHGLPTIPAHLPSGHEMMASTYLYAHAPIPVFQRTHANSNWKRVEHTNSTPDLTNAATTPSSPSQPITPWKVPTSPTSELLKLYAMSTSLVKEDWEITPVQAWFLLAERVGVGRLLADGGRELEIIKKGLADLVRCFGFGAVLSEVLFWAVVEERFA